VRQRYGQIAQPRQSDCSGGAVSSCCGSADQSATSCCGGVPSPSDATSSKLGYSAAELASAPAGANMGLGCGNPQAIAALKPGEVVVDLGSGGGFDCFLAAKQVGPGGRVIGVDMTAEMISKARENAAKGGFANVEFRLGEIEHLPVADGVADAVISNCVINLSPDKPQVYADAFRVLTPGGRLAISDVVAIAEMPESLRTDPASICGCVGGAASVEQLTAMLREAGFAEIRVTVNRTSDEFVKHWEPGSGVEAYVAAASVEAVKPLG